MMIDTKKRTETYEVRHRETGEVIDRTNVLRYAKELANRYGADVYAGSTTRRLHVGWMESDHQPPDGARTESEIAEEWGCHPRTVEYRMRKLGIEPVTGQYSGARRERAWRPEDVTRATVMWAERCAGGPEERLEAMLVPSETLDPDERPRPHKEAAPDHAPGWAPETGPAKLGPELLDLIADRVDRLQIDVSRMGALLARQDAVPDDDEVARLRRPVAAAALLRIAALLGDVDIDAAGPWLVLRRPGVAA